VQHDVTSLRHPRRKFYLNSYKSPCNITPYSDGTNRALLCCTGTRDFVSDWRALNVAIIDCLSCELSIKLHYVTPVRSTLCDISDFVPPLFLLTAATHQQISAMSIDIQPTHVHMPIEYSDYRTRSTELLHVTVSIKIMTEMVICTTPEIDR